MAPVIGVDAATMSAKERWYRNESELERHNLRLDARDSRGLRGREIVVCVEMVEM